MAPHLAPAERDKVLAAHASGKTTPQIHALIQKLRDKQGVAMVNITVPRRYLRGVTHKRGKVESRGRKRAVTRRNVVSMSAARRKIVKGTGGTCQVKWSQIMAKGRSPRVHATTAARAFAREGLDVKFRRSREKPQRAPDVERERAELCGRLRHWSTARFVDGIDMTIDNKRLMFPRTQRPELTSPNKKSSRSCARAAKGSRMDSRSQTRSDTARTPAGL